MSLDGAITNLASWAGNTMMPTMAGLFFAGAVYRYSRGGPFEQFLYGGFASLMCSGMLRALEGFVQHTGATNADVFWMATMSLANWTANVILPMFALTQLVAMALHMGGVVSEIYPGSTWIRKFVAAIAALSVSGIMRLAESMVNVLYCVWLLARRKNIGLLFTASLAVNWLWTLLMGALWIGSFYLYGIGVTRMGAAGGTIGWPILVSVSIGVGGRLDLLVNCAARQIIKKLEDLEPDEWDLVLDVNLNGAYLTSRAALPRLAGQHGAIVNICSVHARATIEGFTSYAASKAGIIALTRAFAIECAPSGVRVNALSPGTIDTPLLHAYFESCPDPKVARQEFLKFHPIGRFGTPRDVAEMVAFLGCSQAGFITGTEIIVDGGMTALLFRQ